MWLAPPRVMPPESVLLPVKFSIAPLPEVPVPLIAISLARLMPPSSWRLAARLMLILEEEGRRAEGHAPDAVVTVFSDDLRERSLAVAAALRAKGLSADVFPGAAKLKHQFKYADQKNAAYALVIGPDEAERGAIQVKTLASGEESAMSLDEAVAKIAARA